MRVTRDLWPHYDPQNGQSFPAKNATRGLRNFSIVSLRDYFIGRLIDGHGDSRRFL